MLRFEPVRHNGGEAERRLGLRLVVRHRVDKHMRADRVLAAVKRLLRDAGRERSARAVTHERYAARVDAELAGAPVHPGERRVAVVESRGERCARREPVVRQKHAAACFERVALGSTQMQRGMAQEEAAAVEVDERVPDRRSPAGRSPAPPSAALP